MNTNAIPDIKLYARNDLPDGDLLLNTMETPKHSTDRAKLQTPKAKEPLAMENQENHTPNVSLTRNLAKGTPIKVRISPFKP